MFKRFDIHTLLICGEHNHAGVILIKYIQGKKQHNTMLDGLATMTSIYSKH